MNDAHTTFASSIPGAVRLLAFGRLPDGVRFAEVPCADYDAFASLPAAVRVDGAELALTGWSSDTGRAFYRAGVAYALRAR